ncbi:hypothetical protein, partial [Zavarzinella formosa]|uniref:hypothetical protein n=1 Tax=Zavarzinella formosa TaxID=360055 RepID=UPI00138AD5ED
MPTTRASLAVLFLVTALGGFAPAAEPAPDDPYHKGLADPVRKLSVLLKDENGADEVAIKIEPGQGGAAPGGEGKLRHRISELLELNKIKVELDTSKGSMWFVAVTYEEAFIPVGNGETKRPGLKIVLTVQHGKKIKGAFEGEVAGVEPAVSVLGRSFDVVGAPTTDKAAEKVIEIIQKKEAVVISGDGKVRAKRDNPKEASPYAVEILVDDKPVTPRTNSGFAVVALPKEKDFWIRLTNDTDFAAAASVTVDGISVFQPGADADGPDKGKPKYTHFVVPAKQSLTVGWHVAADRIDAMKVTSFHDSVAAMFNPARSSPRTVTAVFAAAWEKGQDPAPDEPVRSRGGDDSIGIGRGAPVKVETKVRDMIIGVP